MLGVRRVVSLLSARGVVSLLANRGGASPLATRGASLLSTRATAPEIVQFPALKDNYGFLLHDPATGATAAVDTPEVAPLVAVLQSKGWTLTHILNTHHHADHCGGNVDLKRFYPGLQVVAPAAESAKIRGGVDVAVQGGDVFRFGEVDIETIEVGGHTLGHVAYHVPAAAACFVGDAIFALGCGRMFEGSYSQFWASLGRIQQLPDATALYCAHEYTAANARFALSIEPGNAALVARVADITKMRAAGEPTVPTTLALERATNPFIRPAAVRAALGLGEMADVDVFAELRKRKDTF
ncbi:hydroxyacylglutathione hydrolase [Pelagophyceae sp. CCMP2097]|nr:hydroxyacylglutathione hydrolase [Pelagophyceae sp. CCMP2097]|mmetsp:Transcript_16421/g.55433  ORF Transcript_16421/g.55433 Transcript_16421/m.55433 type:complete len:297 (-) Transcript_16421:103-993(-)